MERRLHRRREGDQPRRPVDGWELEWAFPSGQKVDHGWLANITSSGADVTAKSYRYNSRIGTGKQTSFGFAGSWSSANEAPESFQLNGITRDGTNRCG